MLMAYGTITFIYYLFCVLLQYFGNKNMDTPFPFQPSKRIFDGKMKFYVISFLGCTVLIDCRLLCTIELLSRCEWFSVFTQQEYYAWQMYLCGKSVFGDRRLIRFLILLFICTLLLLLLLLERRQWTQCGMDIGQLTSLYRTHLEDFDMWITRSMIFARVSCWPKVFILHSTTQFT